GVGLVVGGGGAGFADVAGGGVSGAGWRQFTLGWTTDICFPLRAQCVPHPEHYRRREALMPWFVVPVPPARGVRGRACRRRGRRASQRRGRSTGGSRRPA